MNPPKDAQADARALAGRLADAHDAASKLAKRAAQTRKLCAERGRPYAVAERLADEALEAVRAAQDAADAACDAADMAARLAGKRFGRKVALADAELKAALSIGAAGARA